LILAAEEARTEVAGVLLDAGADPNAVNRRSETPLYFALSTMNKPLVELLLGYGARPGRLPVDVFDTPLAVVERRPATASFLGFSLPAVSGDGAR
jgi:ankyrin repeat protein